MGNYLKMQMADKETLCQNIYQQIIEGQIYLKNYEQYAQIGDRAIPTACYTNFRDALFHFRKMVRCSEEHEIMQQAFAVKEHLGRAQTDAKTSVLFYFARVANYLLSKESVEDEIKMEIRLLLHKMKEVVLICRIDGMMMSNVSITNANETEVDNIMRDFLDLMQDKCCEEFVEAQRELRNMKSA